MINVDRTSNALADDGYVCQKHLDSKGAAFIFQSFSNVTKTNSIMLQESPRKYIVDETIEVTDQETPIKIHLIIFGGDFKTALKSFNGLVIAINPAKGIGYKECKHRAPDISNSCPNSKASTGLKEKFQGLIK